jgi:hypothetical protein
MVGFTRVTVNTLHKGNNRDDNNNNNNNNNNTPARTAATAIVTKGFKKFGSHSRRTFNRFTTKAAILGTSHVIRKVLQSDTKSQSGGDER